MNKKYELLKDDCTKYAGNILYRIKALKDFGDVKTGDLGGYIESENNLSHEGGCWVYNNALVCDSARVSDNAKIYGQARIFDYAKVYDNAEVFDKAHIYGDAKVFDNACVFSHGYIYDKAKVFGNARVFDNAEIYDNANIFGDAQIYGNAEVFEDAIVYEKAIIEDHAKIHGDAIINKRRILGNISMPYKDIFQYQCAYETLTAILVEDNKILYSIGSLNNMTEKEFLEQINTGSKGLHVGPDREEFLKLILIINTYFKGVK